MIFVPMIEQLLFIGIKVTSAFSVFTTNIIVYPLLGHFIYKNIDLQRLNGKRFILVWSCNILLIILSCILTYLRAIKTNETDIDHVQAFFNTFVIVNASVVFITFLRIRITSGKIEKLICIIGSCVFGVYLLHPFIMDSKLFSYIHKLANTIVVNPMLGALLSSGVVLCICIVLTYILKKIPGIKNFI